MNTPAHLLIGLAAFGRNRQTRAGAGLGGIIPDLSLYLLAGTSLLVLRIDPGVVFGDLYYSQAWQTVFAIDNSIPLWTALLLIAVWSRRSWAIALCAAALLHLALDFPLHHDDGRPHFWPFTNWVFESPFSYWDRAQGANWLAPLEAALCLVCVAILLASRPGWTYSIFVLLVFGAELWIVRTWLFVFGT